MNTDTLAPNPSDFNRLILKVDDEPTVIWERNKETGQMEGPEPYPDKLDNQSLLAFVFVFLPVVSILGWIYIGRFIRWVGNKFGWW